LKKYLEIKPYFYRKLRQIIRIVEF